MKSNLLCVSALALALTLSACGKSEEATNNVAAENGMNTTMADAGPFDDSEMQMSDAMKQAVGVNASDTWVRKMIEHHKGAVALSNVVLPLAQDPNVRQMAQMTVDKQTKEIADLEKMVATGNPAPASGQLYQPAEMQMHEAMMAAKGADVSETYLRKMLAHHQGAIAMSDVALANGAAGAVRTQIAKTRADQQKEAAMVEAMLRGEPMPSTAAAPVSAPTAARTPAAPVARAEAEAKPAPVAAPAKPKPADPAPVVDPHAGHDMNNM